jgi:hypothetical protein
LINQKKEMMIHEGKQIFRNSVSTFISLTGSREGAEKPCLEWSPSATFFNAYIAFISKRSRSGSFSGTGTIFSCPATATGDAPPTRVNHSSTRVNHSQARVNDPSTRVNDSQTRVNDSQARVNDSQTRVNDPQTRVNALQARESVPTRPQCPPSSPKVLPLSGQGVAGHIQHTAALPVPPHFSRLLTGLFIF